MFYVQKQNKQANRKKSPNDRCKKKKRTDDRGTEVVWARLKQDGSLTLTGHSLRTNSPPDVECPA